MCSPERKYRVNLAQMQTSTPWRISLRAGLREFGWRPKPARVGRHCGRSQPSPVELTWITPLNRFPLGGRPERIGDESRSPRPVRKDDINPLSENRESEQWWHPQLNEETSNGGYGKVSSRPSLH